MRRCVALRRLNDDEADEQDGGRDEAADHERVGPPVDAAADEPQHEKPQNDQDDDLHVFPRGACVVVANVQNTSVARTQLRFAERRERTAHPRVERQRESLLGLVHNPGRQRLSQLTLGSLHFDGARLDVDFDALRDRDDLLADT